MLTRYTIVRITIVLLLVIDVVLPRILDLGTFQTADEKRWLANTTAFTHNLAHGDLKHVMLQPHPGITTQWLAAPTIFARSWNVKKLSLALFTAILALITGYTYYRLWGRTAGTLMTLILATNPFLVAHSRILAMDALLAHFVLLSLTFLLLWKQKGAPRYLVAAGATATLATLSKLPGAILLPFSFLSIGIHKLSPRSTQQSASLPRSFAIWSAAIIITTFLVFPSVFLNTKEVFSDISSFFSSENYLEEHPAPPTYYVRTLLFFSTPLHVFGLLYIPFVWKNLSSNRRRAVMILLIFAVTFLTFMSLGAKKGDRYILPVFLILDAAIVGAITQTQAKNNMGRTKSAISKPAIFIAILISWQAVETARLHPYTLSYINPLTKPFFKERRLGWGEGLDLAANYLNEKDNAQNLTVASFYPSEFGSYFSGNTVPLHQHDHANIDYVVLYRAMFERGESWETDVQNAYNLEEAEKIIFLNNIPYVWIVRR